ncbi:MAG: ABC transporter substrate-binding protein [Thermomicrobiales bacterium]
MLGGSLVYEPLRTTCRTARSFRNLVKEVPSIENALLAEDLTSVTYNLIEGIFWNDGTPFTAHYVVATWALDRQSESAATTSGSYADCQRGSDRRSHRHDQLWAEQSLAWFLPFTGTNVGVVYPKHILDLGEEGRVTLRTAPVGTGPYKVESFVEGDNAQLVINDYYREPNKPFFATVNLKGNVTSDAAARGVIQLGEWDFAWNPQVSPDVLRDYENGGAGTGRFLAESHSKEVSSTFQIRNAEVNGQRSEKNTPHPF